MSLFGLFGKPDVSERAADTAGLVQRIDTELATLPPETAQYVAAFAYVLGRVANADQHVSSAETRTLVDLVQVSGHLTNEQASLVVAAAKAQHQLFAGSDAARVTRRLKQLINDEQRRNLVYCLVAVATADQTISIAEEREIRRIADDLGLDKDELEMIFSSYDSKRESRRG